MRPLSRRLTNLGHPLTIATTGDIVTVYALRWGKDIRGNAIKTPFGPGVAIPAIVTRQPGEMTESNGSTTSVSAYKVMFQTATPPNVTTETAILWGTHNLIAAGGLIASGPGAWQMDAVEYSPDPDGSGLPYNLQVS